MRTFKPETDVLRLKLKINVVVCRRYHPTVLDSNHRATIEQNPKIKTAFTQKLVALSYYTDLADVSVGDHLNEPRQTVKGDSWQRVLEIF